MTAAAYMPATTFVDAPPRTVPGIAFASKPAAASFGMTSLSIDSPGESPWRSVRLSAVRSLPGRVFLAGGVLRQSVSAHVEGVEGGDVLVVEDETQMFGCGEDLASAVQDLRASLVGYRGALLRAGELSVTLRDHLRHLDAVLVPR